MDKIEINSLLSGYLDDDESEKVRKDLEKIRYRSRFGFLKSHMGLRKAELSLLIAPKGGSKSTLIKSICSDLAFAKVPTYMFLSEEKPAYFLYALNRGVKNEIEDKDKAQEYLQNLYVQNQSVIKHEYLENIDVFCMYLKEIIITYDIKIIIFDNISTSFISRFNINEQQRCAEKIKQLAISKNVVFVGVIHTVKGTNLHRQVMTGEDVRGNATWSNLASYIYVLHTYFNVKPARSFVFIDKARYHQESNKAVYELKFNTGTGLFDSDKESSYDELEGMITNRYKRKKIEKDDDGNDKRESTGSICDQGYIPF